MMQFVIVAVPCFGPLVPEQVRTKGQLSLPPVISTERFVNFKWFISVFKGRLEYVEFNLFATKRRELKMKNIREKDSNLNCVQPCKKISKGRKWEDCVNLSLLKVLIFCVDMRPFKFSHHITSLVRCEHLVGSKLQREKFTFNHLTNHALLKNSEVKTPFFFSFDK